MSWNIINNEIGTASNKKFTQTEFKLGSKNVSMKQSAQIFNHYFINSVADLITQQAETELAIFSLRDSFPHEFPQIINSPVTETEVICTLSMCGYAGLSNKILKLCGNGTSKSLTHIYNKLLTSGICPDHLKYTNIKLFQER